jgi:hypothetical protein
LAELVDRQWPGALRVALGFAVVLVVLAWNGFIPARLPPESTTAALAFWSVYTFGAWACAVTAIGLGRRYLRVDDRALAFARRSGYAWYLLHQTAILVVAVWVVTWSANVPVKFAGLALIAGAATVVSASALNRLVGAMFPKRRE